MNSGAKKALKILKKNFIAIDNPNARLVSQERHQSDKKRTDYNRSRNDLKKNDIPRNLT